SRGKLGLRSALAAAASGDVPRAVHLLRRIRSLLPADGDQELRSRVGERLAYYLLQGENKDWYAEALRVARLTVRETPDDPPTWRRSGWCAASSRMPPRSPTPASSAPKPRGSAWRRSASTCSICTSRRTTPTGTGTTRRGSRTDSRCA